jgi:hypothetical protein
MFARLGSTPPGAIPDTQHEVFKRSPRFTITALTLLILDMLACFLSSRRRRVSSVGRVAVGVIARHHGYHGERREAVGSTIRRSGVHRVPSGDALGLQLAHQPGGSASSAAGPTARTDNYGRHARAASAASGDNGAASRGRIRRLCGNR